ncbi:MAG: bifunctional precorrin-2 dehydrogenase/sirohydrochlorin ferrochelatase [Deltaproteobacteria bacterium]|nr:bifunctional precorrin-2 dehydrogenase/sirohydrochlorin ferrochelatase [Deltaproteobacteria bacterium]
MMVGETVKYYPVYLDLRNKSCVVMGAGEVSERKVARLVQCGARVTVVDRQLSPGLERMKRESLIDHIDDGYNADYLRDVFLVIAATDRDDVNEAISRDAKARGVIVNVVDDPERCDFILPSIFERGDLSIAVSTGGKSPALAKKIAMDMEFLFGGEYETLLHIMGALRGKTLAKGLAPSKNRVIFEAVIQSDILRCIREGDREGVKRIIRDITGLDMGWRDDGSPVF